MDPLVASRSFASQLRCVALSLIAIALASHWHCIGFALASHCNFIALESRCVALRSGCRPALHCVALQSHRTLLRCIVLR